MLIRWGRMCVGCGIWPECSDLSFCPWVVRWKSLSIKQLGLFCSSTLFSVLGTELEFRLAYHSAFTVHKSSSEVYNVLFPSLNDCRGHTANLWKYSREEGKPEEIIQPPNITIVFLYTPTYTYINVFFTCPIAHTIVSVINIENWPKRYYSYV